MPRTLGLLWSNKRGVEQQLNSFVFTKSIRGRSSKKIGELFLYVFIWNFIIPTGVEIANKTALSREALGPRYIQILSPCQPP